MAGAAVAFALLRGDAAAADVAPNSVAVVDPARNRVVDTIAVGIGPEAVAAGPGGVWVANVDGRMLARISPETRRVAKYVSLTGTPTGIAVRRDGAVWVAYGLRGQLVRVDPSFGPGKPIRVTRTAFGSSRGSVALGPDAVWVVYGDSTLARVDPSTGRSTGKTFAGITPVGVAVGASSVWVANGGESTVERFNPETFEEGPVRDPITVGNRPTGIAYGERAVWVTNGGDDTVRRIDPNGNSTRSIPVGKEPSAVAVGAAAVWVANTGDGTVSRIDPATYDVETIRVGGAPAGIVVADGHVWVAVRAP